MESLLIHWTRWNMFSVNLHERLTWKTYVIKKREQLKLRLRSVFWIFKNKNKLSVSEKILLYVILLFCFQFHLVLNYEFVPPLAINKSFKNFITLCNIKWWMHCDTSNIRSRLKKNNVLFASSVLYQIRFSKQ